MPKASEGLTAKLLRRSVDYNPDTGIFTTIKRKRSTKHGRIMGWSDKLGYIHIRVGRIGLYLGHRLAWLYVYGKWPTGHLDHINGNPADNRIENLRECNQRQNLANSKIVRVGRSIRKGVSFDNARKLYRAYITVDRKQIFIGRYTTIEAAVLARVDAEQKYHGAFARAA